MSTDTIPKLNRIEYLFDTLGAVEDGLSFDEIRKELIASQPESQGRKKAEKIDSLMTNTRDALRESMKLGLINKAPLPTLKKHLEAHRNRKFELTPEGVKFLKLASDVWEFRDRFAQAMLLAHPHFRSLVSVLSSGELYFPRIQRADVPGELGAWRGGLPEPLGKVSSWLTDEVQKATGEELSADRIESNLRPYLNAAWKKIDWDEKPNVVNKKIVKTFNDVSIRAILTERNLKFDCVTFRSAVALLSDLGALSNTHTVPGRRGWTVWKTSTVEIPQFVNNQSPAAQALEGKVWFNRLMRPEEEICDLLVEEFLSSSDRKGGFVLIHVLRAKVCHRLGIHSRDFDSTLRKMHDGSLVHAEYAINLDRGSSNEVPPSEQPFAIKGRAFYLMTLLNRKLMERN